MTNNDVAARRFFETQGADYVIRKASAVYTEALLALLSRYLRRGDMILDICCGYGRLTLPLLQQGFEVTGIDISESLLAKGCELLRTAHIAEDRFALGNMKELPVRSGAFDAAFCVWASFNFLVSAGEQRQALREMSRVLKPGGRAVIECPLHETAAGIETVREGQVSHEYYPLTIAEMTALAAQSPFAVSDVFVEAVPGRGRRMLAVLRK
jgi:ubiquinone/menaquinone biosynthesis C-methylase UbiE